MLQMHLMPKCIFATHHIFQRKMFSVHFTLENVQHHIFQRKMFSKTKCYKCVFATQRVHFPKENVQLCKNAFDATLTFCLQNVRKRQNAFWRTFSKEKCSAYIFQRKMFSCAKMHLMQKCI